jgi:hypothetical protein
MFFSTRSAGALPGPDFCFIFAPGGYDEPEILPSGNPSICLMGADGEQTLTWINGARAVFMKTFKAVRPSEPELT